MVVKSVVARVNMNSKKHQKNHRKNDLNNKKSMKNIIKTNDDSKLNLNPEVKLITTELKFAKVLAGNDATLRTKNLNKLKKWFKTRSSSTYRKLKIVFN